jgi:S1-C subfamily serine protease
MPPRSHLPLLSILLLGFAQALSAKESPVESPGRALGSTLTSSVVRIDVTTQEADYRSPWNAGRIGGGVGSGFVVTDGKKNLKILTNAHVVSNARFIQLTRDGVSHPFTARVEFIAHDCDLALLTVDDPAFFTGTVALDFGGVPTIESVVSVYGYPLGGERLSVTRGIVSRVDFNTYSHSAVDSHLVVQIDAAINPGNSGGPVLQDGKVVGVAFQGYSGDVAQNVGFMIPTPVIARFLRDISKGSYTGYTDLSIAYRPLIAEASRKALDVTRDDHGVLVTDVHEAGSAHGYLRRGDVLLSIDGHDIESNGRVELDGQSIEMAEVVERKFEGEKVSFGIQREGKPLRVEFPLRGTWPFRMQANSYDEKPRYLLHGGLLFQPLDRNFMSTTGTADMRLSRAFDDFVERHIYKERPEIVVLSRILADPVNKDCDGLRQGIVEKINGMTIRSLTDVKNAFAAPARFDVISLEGPGIPIVLKREEVLKAAPRIMERYGIPSPQNLQP